ncbi:RecQ family ATP-dependent DNA helicase [Lacibacter sp. H407]|uniref:RecQ family ATP-dependent DNA helicase n=1 Tax=Lacibacter sp. H407 TaxID=3133423 RepID=UPI0030C28E6B
MDNLENILSQYWGYDSFRPLQKEIIESVLQGKDTLALLPTGGGKSICYQVPALAKDGMCIVISPLIALMKDQVEALHRKDIRAAAIYTGMPFPQVKDILQMAVNDQLKFLYVSPERLETKLFLEYLPGMNVQLIAVDEAHCISQWGYDFRPSYLKIKELRSELRNVPLLAVTASATPVVQDDICNQLQFRNHHIYKGSFLRPNVSFSVFKVESRINKIIQILSNVQGCAIVYCKSRKMTQETAQLLQLQHISADYYHAGLSNDERSKRQEAWLQNQTRVIVCTNAFGMGIDKPDVRVVIHHDMPDCLENYYQEAGRAGRDGQKSYAVLLYEEKDLTDLANASAIRFPSIAEVKKVYQCLVNYLQLPSGSGELIWMDFDLQDFVRTFKLNMHTAVYALKTLEQEGWINYAEQIFLPAKVVFTANKDRIAEFEQQHPQLEPFIKALLRNYGGIFDMESFISEKQLVSIVKTDLEIVKQALLQLHQHGIIHYSPQKDNAQLQFSENRPAVDDLFINPHNRLQRKEQFELRVKAMLNYVNDESSCRSKIIGNYFGDAAIVDCGVCDVCLRKKGNDLTTAEFERIRLFLTEKASGNGVVLKDLLTKMGSKQKERVWKVIDHLVAEEKITLSKEGLMKIK